MVALLAESVDRNACMIENVVFIPVALLAESVDRNDHLLRGSYTDIVALLAESVDRNASLPKGQRSYSQSLSLRRAWIEIRCPCCSVRLLARRSPCGERG